MDISKFDNTLDNARFLTKVDNIFIMLYSGVMKKNLDTAKHKISDEIYNKYNNYVEELKKDGLIQMYGELNVKSTTIEDIYETEDKIIVKVELISRFLNYFLDEETLEYVRGNKDRREEHINKLTLEKIKNSKELGAARHCPSCGAHMNLSRSGKCTYCGAIFNLEEYDYILTDIVVY